MNAHIAGEGKINGIDATDRFFEFRRVEPLIFRAFRPELAGNPLGDVHLEVGIVAREVFLVPAERNINADRLGDFVKPGRDIGHVDHEVEVPPG